MQPFDLGDLVRRPGRRAGLQRLGQVALPAAAGPRRHRPRRRAPPVDDPGSTPVAHTGVARLGARVRPGCFAQTHDRPELVGPTLLRDPVSRRRAPRRHGPRGRDAALAGTSWPHSAEQRFEHALRRPAGPVPDPAAGAVRRHPAAARRADRQPRPGQSAEALEDGLEAFEGTVIAVTHDRWFARSFDRFLVFGADGRCTSRPSRSGMKPGWPARGVSAPIATRGPQADPHAVAPFSGRPRADHRYGALRTGITVHSRAHVSFAHVDVAIFARQHAVERPTLGQSGVVAAPGSVVLG